jgi:toxin-antitoxin system PIN domain toxin
MILIDVNLLVYASATESPQHKRSRSWLERELRSGEPVGIPWESLNGFVRIVCQRRFFERPATLSDAWDRVRAWLDHPNVWIPSPTESHMNYVGELIESGHRGNDIHDIHLAALAISHGLRLATHDHGFARFEGLRWFDPLS